ncbi:MAG: epimerase, partial [Candidatus Acidiferrales bacterium]
QTIGRKPRMVHVPPSLALFCVRVLGYLVGDVILTRQELEGLRQNLLLPGGPPTGRIRFADWLEQNAATLGLRYASELQRHFR